MSELASLDVPDFILQKGGFLPNVSMAYRTLGTLNAAKDNAVLVPSWYTGTDSDSETYLVGKDRALDPTKYFIILTNLLANGLFDFNGVHWSFQGLITSTPQPSKSFTLRVATGVPAARAMAAIWQLASVIGRPASKC